MIPGGTSSTNEQDSRHVAKILDLPLLEPATFQEAKDMTKWAFELSEAISNACMLRTVTRISHGRGNVVFGELPAIEKHAHFDTSKTYNTGGKGGKVHRVLHEKLKKIEEIFESAPFNFYEGPEKPDLLIVTCGIGWLYSIEAGENTLSEKISRTPEIRHDLASSGGVFAKAFTKGGQDIGG